jgi:hypothetical protein
MPWRAASPVDIGRKVLGDPLELAQRAEPLRHLVLQWRQQPAARASRRGCATASAGRHYLHHRDEQHHAAWFLVVLAERQVDGLLQDAGACAEHVRSAACAQRCAFGPTLNTTPRFSRSTPSTSAKNSAASAAAQSSEPTTVRRRIGRCKHRAYHKTVESARRPSWPRRVDH